MPYRAVPYHLTKMCDVHASFVVVKMLQGWACYTLIHITSIYGSSCANNGKDALNTLDETWLADVIRIMPPILVAPTIKLRLRAQTRQTGQRVVAAAVSAAKTATTTATAPCATRGRGAARVEQRSQGESIYQVVRHMRKGGQLPTYHGGHLPFTIPFDDETTPKYQSPRNFSCKEKLRGLWYCGVVSSSKGMVNGRWPPW
eukprot:1176339-Prorocentrum_minimum.AAC.2